MNLEKRIKGFKQKVDLLKDQEERLIDEVGGKENFEKITGELSVVFEKYNIDKSPALLGDLFLYIQRIIS